jgi:hypothetical protein
MSKLLSTAVGAVLLWMLLCQVHGTVIADCTDKVCQDEACYRARSYCYKGTPVYGHRYEEPVVLAVGAGFWCCTASIGGSADDKKVKKVSYDIYSQCQPSCIKWDPNLDIGSCAILLPDPDLITGTDVKEVFLACKTCGAP